MLRHSRLSRQPAVFWALTGLAVAEYDALAAEAVPALAAADRRRLSQPGRRRVIWAGRPPALAPRDQVLLAAV